MFEGKTQRFGVSLLMNHWKLYGCVLLASTGATVCAETTFTSGPTRVSLLELYTSEGCSSCPPAEALLAKFCNDPRLWKEIVPVAFHVTYFDRLGWKDRFGSEAFTERQKAYREHWSAENIYTPCLVENGIEWHSRPKTPTAAPAPGTLSVHCNDEGHVSVTFQPLPGRVSTRLGVSAALLGGDLNTHVSRGENAGKTLDHQFVALELKHARLTEQTNGAMTASFAFPKPSQQIPRLALAVWVSGADGLVPIQAAGGWLQ
jgi:hypothetical protein